MLTILASVVPDSLGVALELHIYDILVSWSSALSSAVDCFEMHQLFSPCDVFAEVVRFSC